MQASRGMCIVCARWRCWRRSPSRRLRDASDQPADHGSQPGQGLHVPDAAEVLQEPGKSRRPRVFGRRHAGGRVLLRRSRVPPAHRGHCKDGEKVRLLDAVNMITGVSGGSFTALAYGLYGDKLFDDYEQRFLKRDVQGELIARALSPAYWGDLSSHELGPLRARGPAVRRDPVQRRDLRRPRPRQRPVHRGVGDRHRVRRLGYPSTRTSSTCCARTSMPCGCPAPPRHRPPCPSCCRPSRSTTTAAPATIPFRPGPDVHRHPRIRRGPRRARYAS